MVLDDSIKIGKYAIPRNCITLGKGSFAYVLLGHEDQEPTKKAAIKVISKKKLNSFVWGKELEILEMLNKFRHENLVTFIHSEESRDHIFLVTEFCNGGDLEKYLNTVKVIPEPSLAHLLRHIGAGLQCLKQLNIVHRDLKPANILMSFPDVGPKNFFDITFKIADFGFAKLLEEQTMTSTICGSPIYMAPEIYKCQSYNYKADMWSVGVIAHQCALGRVPFCERSYERLGRVYKDGKATFELPDNLCRELKGLLKMLLVQDADKRLEFEKFISHPFLLLHSESSTHFRRSSESAIKMDIAKKEATRLGTSTVVMNNFGNRRSSTNASSGMDKSLLDGFVVVEHSMIPDAENFEVVYNKSHGIKLSPPQKTLRRKVMVTRDTQTSMRFDSCVDNPGCSVDPDVCKMKELKRRNEMAESSEIKRKSLMVACINLDDIVIPDVSLDFESKITKVLTINGDWSSLETDHEMSDSKTSLSTVFDDLNEHFVSSELDEKLLMELEEVTILAKLEFLLKFTQFAIRLAEHGSLWVVSLPSSSSSPSSSSTSITSLSASTPLLGDDDRLCLYAMCLSVTLSTINSAKKAAEEARVSPSKTFRKIVSALKDAYTSCLKRSEEVKRRLPKERCDAGGSHIKAAETILYLFAVAAAREGAKAEFSLKNFHECCQYYHIAYVFFHWVEMKSRRNKASIREYKNRIEGRLKYFQNNYVVPCND